MGKMKVGLIQAFRREDREMRNDPPLGLAFLASYLEREVPEVEVFYEDELEHLLARKPDLVGISSYSCFFNEAQEFGRAVKETLGVPVILGGLHITSLPGYLPSCFDVGVLGEGEETFIEVVRHYLNGHPQSGLDKIKGIVYTAESGEAAKTEERELISPLDKIPLPKRELLQWTPLNHYLHTSRGCPFHCTFCSPTVYWKRFRGFSPEYIIRDMKSILNRYAFVSQIMIHDDLFIASKKRFRRLVELIESEGIQRKVMFSCAVKASTVDEEACRLLKRMNVTEVSMGLESANPRILAYLKKETSTVEDNQRAIDLLHEHGMRIHGAFIVMSPDEEWHELLDTLTCAIDNWEKMIPEVLFLMPLPGTPIWELALRKGAVSEGEEMDWSRLNQKINLNQKIGKYEFYRLYQACQQLARKTPHDRARLFLDVLVGLLYNLLQESGRISGRKVG